MTTEQKISRIQDQQRTISSYYFYGAITSERFAEQIKVLDEKIEALQSQPTIQ